VNSGAPEGLTVPAPHVTPIVLLLNDTNIIWYVNQLKEDWAAQNVSFELWQTYTTIRDQSRNVGHIALTNCWTC